MSATVSPTPAADAVTPTQAAAYAASDANRAVARALKLLEGVTAIFDAAVDDERGLSEGERWAADYIVDAVRDTLENGKERVLECMHTLYNIREGEKTTTASKGHKARKAVRS